MRTPKIMLLAALCGLAACSKYQRKYDPQRRSGQSAGGGSPTAEPTSTPKENGAPAAPAEGAPATPAPTAAPPEITDRKWCTLRHAGFEFIVDRYVFQGGDHPATTHEQLLFTPNTEPQVRVMPAPPAWTMVSSAQVGNTAAELGVEALDVATAQATPAFHDQAMVFNTMIDTASIEVSLDSLGTDGAVRVTRPGQPEQVLFDCQNYSDDFVALDVADAGKPGAQSKSAQAPAVGSTEAESSPTTSTPPAAPSAADRGTVRAFAGSLTAINVKDVNLTGTRWCSYKTAANDVIVGLLAIDQGKFTLNHLRASMLKGSSIDKAGLRKAAISRPVRGEITGAVDSKFMTSAGPAFRLVRDQRDQRALILDTLGGADRPSSTAEIFFSCDADQSPLEDETVAKNLVTAATLAKALR